jgi:hypothetical protein
VEDDQLHRLRLGAGLARRGQAHVDPVAGAKAGSGLDHLAVDPDLTVVDEAPDLRSSERAVPGAERIGEVLIEAACRTGLDGELEVGYQIFDLT